jgi:drug/metabolite transporter (DMT)-like permease
MIHLQALIGVLSISFSAVLVRLAGVSPVTATFFRAAYAIPVLAIVRTIYRAEDRRPGRARVLAFVSGMALSTDLGFWHESIALIGAGLATVVINVQVVFVALAAWAIYGERPSARSVAIIVSILVGITLTSGLAHHDAYGTNPVLAVLLGVLAGAWYAGFLIMFRAANRSLAPTSGPLLDATLGLAAGALLLSPFDAGFSLVPVWPAHYWLIALALIVQVVGWLLIAVALPRLPAVETSILLLVQPAFAVIWGMLLLGERLSALQWVGTMFVLGGIASLTLAKGKTIQAP